VGIPVGEAASCPPSTRAWNSAAAAILKVLGFDHTKLTFKFQGRNFRLTDVHGNVVEKMLA
jgi:hypothetical protein